MILTYLILGSIFLVTSRFPQNGKVPVNNAPQKGFVAPPIELNDITGQVIRLSDFQGKPVMINFWATWCPPCRLEMPAIQSVYANHIEDNLVVLAINTTYQDDVQEVRKFMLDKNIKFSVLLDMEGKISRDYKIQALPTSFFIYPDGRISEILYGGPLSETVLEVQIQTLLKR
jgi:peroxiredoxin